MAFPDGVQLATLTFSNPITHLGTSATRTEVTIEPTASVVWAATGQPVDDFPETVAPGSGAPGSIQAPFVDQAGFKDAAGNTFTMWAYRVTRRAFFGNLVKTVAKSWQPVIGQNTLDFDLIPEGAVGLAVSTPAVHVSSVNGLTGAVTLAKGDVGLGSVDNTTDAAKPVSAAQQTALDAKAPLASPAFTGTPTGITKVHVGLGSVDNTADTAKPVSTAQAAALALKLDASQKGAASGVAPLDSGARVADANLPVRLGDAALNATYAGLIQLAKNPDTLIAGAVTLDGSDQVTSAAVLWPDGSPGTMTITARHATGAVNAYNITYGSPVTKTYTQPTITRNAAGAATNVPQIVVS